MDIPLQTLPRSVFTWFQNPEDRLSSGLTSRPREGSPQSTVRGARHPFQRIGGSSPFPIARYNPPLSGSRSSGSPSDKNVVESTMAIFQTRFAHADPDLLARRTLQKTGGHQIPVQNRIPESFPPLEPHFQVALAGEYTHAPYRTIYWDTRERKSLFDHHRGKRPRFKVRIRHHIGRGAGFLEVKSNRGREGLPRPDFPSPMQPRADFRPSGDRFGQPPIRPPRGLEARHDHRIQSDHAGGYQLEERMTVDTDLIFRDGERDVALPGLAIVEIKQARWNHQSPSMQTLRAHKIRATAISKYLTGAQFLWPDLKLNRHKPNLREIRRVLGKRENEPWNN